MATISEEAKRELLRKRLELKREIDKASLNSVEALLEKNISEDQLLEHCKHLWQQSYQDCTEERALGELCGYPLCDNPVPPQNQKMPKYKISLSRKKVYSTEKQRLFCGLRCHERSEYLKSQLEELPLWMLQGSFNKKITLRRDEHSNSNSNFDGNILPGVDRVSLNEVENLSEKVDSVSLEDCTGSSGPFFNAPPSFETPTENKQAELLPSDIFTVEKLEDMLLGWFTISTLHHVVGQERFLQLRAEFDQGSTAPERSPDEHLIAYENLCLFLEQQEKLEGITHDDDDDDDEGEEENKGKRKRETKVLKKVSKQKNKRITFQTPSVDESSNASKTMDFDESPDPELAEPILPPVDKHHRNLLREKILLERLSPLVESVSISAGVSAHSLGREVADMIHTFKLNRDNCAIRHDEAAVVLAVILMLLDRKAGGEGQISKEIRQSLDESLKNIGLSWGDVCLALQKATNPRRVFASHRNS